MQMLGCVAAASISFYNICYKLDGYSVVTCSEACRS